MTESEFDREFANSNMGTIMIERRSNEDFRPTFKKSLNLSFFLFHSLVSFSALAWLEAKMEQA